MPKAKLQISKATPPIGSGEGHGAVNLGFGRVSRHCATALAIFAGCLAVGNLWVVPLSVISLLEAGRGVILLLLGIGLMGTARLSLVLTLLVALAGLDIFTAAGNATSLMAIIEVCLVTTAAFALVTPR